MRTGGEGRRRARSAPAVLLAALMLAGCAATRPAPVEDRSQGGTTPATPAPAGESATGVQVSPVAEAPAATITPLNPARDSAGDAGANPRRGAPPPANPAVVALLNRANRESRAGRHGVAAASLERALKIEPRNAWLWHRLASARLAQGEPGAAASLAAKSNTLAAGDPRLQARNWRLIAEVHRRRGEDVAAREAERRARELDTPAS